MKAISLVLAVLVMVAVAGAMPMFTKMSADTTVQLVWVNSGAGVETRLANLSEPTVIFQPVLMIEPVGLRWYTPTTPFKYAQVSALLTANNTGTLPHAGVSLHAGPYFAGGMTFGDCPPHFYLSSEELVKTIFNWIGKAGGVIVKKI